ncbi:helix-turn-helix domain-containing protein [Halopiger xanaduensis]|uniref:Bacterio-opsin activator HTH domain protein n=1 Tax=Halopiger xanaduensis (strain DSM 18323 / JCM 14033 / SH-6) TaxID=797210 RepID=F8DCR6_HALXS|nr:helix-turn-helix domain-containing protein [Halopiger xanaduensis]AEH37240.1 Bacterio-opsin activator HTH domain protein [Halopiger xanaduensis SH-6]
MRYLEVTLQRPPAEQHPMHRFIVEHEGYTASRLLYGHQYGDEYAMLFYIDGPRLPYEPALEDAPTVLDYELAPCRDDSFYLYVRESLTGADRTFVDAVEQPGLIIIPPVEFRADGTIRLAAVGPDEAIQTAVDDVADTARVDVRSVGEYCAGRIDARVDLTRRQFEAVSAAVDCGYYRATRNGSLEDVAERLDCSSGTAGELLRRAERTVMAGVVDGGPF